MQNATAGLTVAILTDRLKTNKDGTLTALIPQLIPLIR